MTDLAGFLSQLEAALTRLDRQGLLRALRPGLSAVEVQEILGSVGLTSNAELEALYGWRDGTSTEGVAAIDDIHMFPGFCLLSLGDAIANYRAFVTDRRWEPGWLPVFANGGGDFYVVDLGSHECPARHFRIDESEHPIEFSSIKDMLRTLAQAFERGTFFMDAGGYLEMDDLAFGTLAAELNPHTSAGGPSRSVAPQLIPPARVRRRVLATRRSMTLRRTVRSSSASSATTARRSPRMFSGAWGERRGLASTSR